jgi:hypothetical protein
MKKIKSLNLDSFELPDRQNANNQGYQFNHLNHSTDIMSEWKTYKLGDLYSEPSKNGLTKPSAIRGSGYKMVNMKEIFAYDRMDNIPMERVPLTEKEERFILKSSDLLFARQSEVVLK